MNEWLPNFKSENLLSEIAKSTSGLVYISETDAPIEPFFGGQVESVDVNQVVQQMFASGNLETVNAKQFFVRLTAEKDWFGEREKQTARRFSVLQKLLEANLRDIKVFKIGHIQIEIYVVGLDAHNNLIGIKTKAVET